MKPGTSKAISRDSPFVFDGDTKIAGRIISSTDANVTFTITTEDVSAPGANIASLAIMAGVEEDVKELCDRVVGLFDEFKALRFSYFVDIWKDMNFGLIFCGRQIFRELYEFTEDLVNIVKKQALSPGDMAYRAASSYLLYAIYVKQPLAPKVPIKLTSNEYADMLDFIAECRKERHWDLVYVWTKLMADHDFQYSVTGSPMGLEMALALEKKQLLTSLQGHSQVRENPFRIDEVQNCITSLEMVHVKYVTMKECLRRTFSKHKPDPSLELASKELPRIIENIAANAHVSTRAISAEGNLLTDAEGNQIGDRRKRIREKAFSKEKLTQKEKHVKLWNLVAVFLFAGTGVKSIMTWYYGKSRLIHLNRENYALSYAAGLGLGALCLTLSVVYAIDLCVSLSARNRPRRVYPY